MLHLCLKLKLKEKERIVHFHFIYSIVLTQVPEILGMLKLEVL